VDSEQKWAFVAEENRDNFTKQMMGFIGKHVAGSQNRIPGVALLTEKALGFLQGAMDVQQWLSICGRLG
jgi:hypothetical protein